MYKDSKEVEFRFEKKEKETTERCQEPARHGESKKVGHTEQRKGKKPQGKI